MLKLPKGLKKKKKGKKSKKDQELFTEEELEQYRREHQAHPEPAADEQATSEHQSEQQQHHAGAAASGADDEWSKFAALTTGVDSILKKTQGDLDRIKSTSFFQRVPPPSEVKKAEEEKQAAEQAAEEAALVAQKEADEKDPVKALIDAVVELSESEPESEDEDDIFNTAYTEQELPLAYVPESPELEQFDGPDPFDTSYADKVIKGPEVSKRGRKIVNIGSAVEVLSGRVEKVTATSVRKRRGPINLLESFDHDHTEDGGGIVAGGALPVASQPKSLLDDPADLPDDVPIDLSVSLHLVLQQKPVDGDGEKATKNEEDSIDILQQFDSLKKTETDEVDEFAELAAESVAHHPLAKAKPARPQLPKAVAELAAAFGEEEPEPDYDPFDTGFVEEVLPLTKLEDNEFDPRALDEDSDFDPRADEEEVTTNSLQVQKALAKDLLSGSSADLTEVVGTLLAPCAPEIDPFDTSTIDRIVKPGKTELKFLEKELLDNNNAASKLKQSLSDPDFDPRAEEEDKAAQAEFESLAKRKSSLSLHINNNNLPSKLVSFAVATPDLLKADANNKVQQKPLTPYYNRKPSIAESDDPFDTSFVPTCQPTQVEINLLEKDFLSESHLTHSLSDPDFDPRAITPISSSEATNFEGSKRKIVSPTKADLLSVDEDINIKVLTPATEDSLESYIDPFDTTIAGNLLPGKAELKVLEDELCPAKPQGVKDVEQILAEPTDNSIYTKVLTPQPRESIDFGGSLDDIDPFDTSIANNLAPGETEIKLLEKELIN